MLRFRSLSALAVVVAVTILLTTVAARADTYQTFLLYYDDHAIPYGLDSNGDAVVVDSEPCPTYPPSSMGGQCYITFSQGIEISRSATAPVIDHTPPAITPPSGPGCGGLPSYITSSDLAFNFCINGYEYFGLKGYFDDPTTGKLISGVFTGPDLVNDRILLGGFTTGTAFVDSYGDLLWDNQTREDIFELYNVTAHVPEPASLTLFATGILVTEAAIRRRRL